MSTVIKSSLLA